MGKDILDFIGIGAMKSGTTSLFEYLRTHPEIYIPAEKETPYRGPGRKDSEDWKRYIDTYFGGAETEKKWGTIAPQYMERPRLAETLRQLLPDVRLVAILRNPIDRAYSSYRVNVGNRRESRDFQEIVPELLSAEALEQARGKPTPFNSYVMKGEYGRILAVYYELFAREQIAVYFFEELKRNPEDVMRSIFQFLGVDSEFVPHNLGVAYNIGGLRRRVPWLGYHQISGSRMLRPLKPIWRVLIPMRSQSLFWGRFKRWNVLPDKPDPIPSVARSLLVEHYSEDTRQLSKLIGREVPWAAEW